MNRIARVFGELKKQSRTALIPYITAGDPHPRHTVELMHALVEGGADVLELGVPFSDPMADGPVIQLACERALAHHTSLRMILEMVQEFRRSNSSTPVVLMGYLNPIERMGLDAFVEQSAAAGVDGVLTVDLPVEEAPQHVSALKQKGLESIFLLAPTSPDARISAAAELGGGYLYYVSLKGVTGAANLDIDSVRDKLSAIRSLTELPVAVGFGIRDAASAAAVAEIADGVVVGSALVGEIERHGKSPESLRKRLIDKLQAMRDAMDQV